MTPPAPALKRVPAPLCDVCGTEEQWGSHSVDAKDLVLLGAPGKMVMLVEFYYLMDGAEGITSHMPWMCKKCIVVALKTGTALLEG